MFCGQNGTPYHSMVRLRVGTYALFNKGRGNTAAIIMASHADAKALHMSSVAQYGLKNFFCDHRGPPYTCMCMHHPKIIQEVKEPLPLDLQVTSHKPHVFSHS